jgi:predicted nucleic acid-binding Zn ribbon protein
MTESVSPEPLNRDELDLANGKPIADALRLKSSKEVAREALNRAKGAARAKGLYPGKEARRSPIEAQVSGARSGGRDPRSLSDTLGSLLVQRGWNQDVAVGGVIGRWTDIVGTDIAAHSTAETFENNVLTVRAHSTAWATQLKFLMPELMRRIAQEIGNGVVQEIRILGPDSPKFSRGRFSVKGRGARDTWG